LDQFYEGITNSNYPKLTHTRATKSSSHPHRFGDIKANVQQYPSIELNKLKVKMEGKVEHVIPRLGCPKFTYVSYE